MDNVVDSLIKQLNEVAEEVCDKVCKYREEYGDTDQLTDEKCGDCPLCKLVY